MYVILLDLTKAYDALDRSRSLEILKGSKREGGVLGNRTGGGDMETNGGDPPPPTNEKATAT